MFNLVETYHFWEAALAGKQPALDIGNVHLGYWRFKTKGHTNGGDAVGLWIEDEKLMCMIGDRIVADLENVFDTQDENKVKYSVADLMTWICRNPVSYEDYSKRMDGGSWAGLNDAVTAQIDEEARHRIGGNNPPSEDPFDKLNDQITQLSGEVIKLLKGGAAKTEDEAKKAGDLAERLGKLWTQADKEREAEKAPYWKRCQEIQEKWRPLLTAAEVYKKIKEAVITPWQREADNQRLAKLAAERAEAERIKREAAEAQRRADEEAQRIADQAAQGQINEEDAKAAVTAAAEQADLLQEQAAEAERQADQTAKSTVKVATRGRAIALKSFLVVKCIDRRQASGALKDNGQFLDEIDKLIEKYAYQLKTGAGQEIPGVEYKIEQRAA